MIYADTKDEAVQFAESNGVKFAVYDDIPLETANVINNALMTLPEEARPKSISSTKNLQKAYGSKIRNSNEFYGVSVNTQGTINFGNGRYDFDGGEMIGINTTTYKTLEDITKRKEKIQAAYVKKTGNKWFFNEKGEATVYHEFGHAYENYYGLPAGFEADAKRWLKESGCDILKSPKEAWAEAWGAYHTGNKDLPDYIAKYIEKATAKPIAKTIAKSAKSGIIKVDDIATASSRYLNKYDKLFTNSANIKPLDNFEDIVVHGDEYGVAFKDFYGNETDLTAREFVEILKSDTNYKGGNIRLISCKTGGGYGIVPQYIANELNIDVLAPTEDVQVFPDGDMYVTDDIDKAIMGINTGEWKLFKPKGR